MAGEGPVVVPGLPPGVGSFISFWAKGFFGSGDKGFARGIRQRVDQLPADIRRRAESEVRRISRSGQGPRNIREGINRAIRRFERDAADLGGDAPGQSDGSGDFDGPIFAGVDSPTQAATRGELERQLGRSQLPVPYKGPPARGKPKRKLPKFKAPKVGSAPVPIFDVIGSATEAARMAAEAANEAGEKALRGTKEERAANKRAGERAKRDAEAAEEAKRAQREAKKAAARRGEIILAETERRKTAEIIQYRRELASARNRERRAVTRLRKAMNEATRIGNMPTKSTARLPGPPKPRTLSLPSLANVIGILGATKKQRVSVASSFAAPTAPQPSTRSSSVVQYFGSPAPAAVAENPGSSCYTVCRKPRNERRRKRRRKVCISSTKAKSLGLI